MRAAALEEPAGQPAQGGPGAGADSPQDSQEPDQTVPAIGPGVAQESDHQEGDGQQGEKGQEGTVAFQALTGGQNALEGSAAQEQKERDAQYQNPQNQFIQYGQASFLCRPALRRRAPARLPIRAVPPAMKQW